MRIYFLKTHKVEELDYMEKQLLQVRQLTPEDLPALERMKTGIKDDYVIHIFDRLMESPTQKLFGLFKQKQLISIAGYSLFGQCQFAMIGRLRSDLRYRAQGYATELLAHVTDHIKKLNTVKWMGANTHVHNLSARRLLEKAGLDPWKVTHYLTLINQQALTQHTPGSLWEEVTDTQKKREILSNLNNNELGLFPYECYYPFPYDEAFFTNQYLADAHLYMNSSHSRVVLIKNDQKKHDYSHVKYFWNDHYEQPGFFETVLQHWHQNPQNTGCWIDFSDQGFRNIPDLTPYDVQKPWMLYGSWT